MSLNQRRTSVLFSADTGSPSFGVFEFYSGSVPTATVLAEP
jgi:hypothetical protein